MPDDIQNDSLMTASSFSWVWTGICGLIVALSIGLLVWASTSISPLDRIPYPDRALRLVVSRSLDLEAAIARLPKWEQHVYRVLSGKGYAADMIDWYEQLHTQLGSSQAAFELAVLYGETEQLDRLRRLTAGWEHRRPPLSIWHDMLAVAYLGREVDEAKSNELQALLAETVSHTWFYTQVARRLAERKGDSVRLAMVEQDARGREDKLLWRVRAFTVLEGFVILLGIAGAGYLGIQWFRHGSEGLVVVAHKSLPPAWPWQDGVAVVVRGGAISALLLFGLLSLPLDQDLLQLFSLFALHLPVLGLAVWFVFCPHGLSSIRQFGLRVQRGAGWTLVMWVGVVIALNLLGGWTIGFVAGAIGCSLHWTDWFEPHLAWGDIPQVGLVLAEYVVLAPFFEECVFRGVVFATCRVVLAWIPAALVSAALFAVAHGYSLIGFVTVLWSGFLWAWTYEKTGSLWPGMLGHSLNNLLFSLMLLAFFR
ncbi:MAG: CPBP family intramembrane metalloprotease [Nitrospirae bacterium]|nr:MAG: CPBP family intramembrane metalloprotease [Nitrospirota bacterium]